MVNGLGNGTLKVGSDEWYALQKKGDILEEQIKAYNRGIMGVLDGEKAVTAEEQAQNQAGINNANSTVGREQIQPGINNANSTVRREQIQPGINNANSMIGDGRQPGRLEELREAEENVNLYNIVFEKIEEETGISDPGLIISTVLENMTAASLANGESGWEWADKLLKDVEEQTGYDYYGALENLDREQKNFEEYQRVEGIKTEATHRISEELEDNPEFSLINWLDNDLEMHIRIRSYAREKIQLSESIELKKASLLDGSLSDEEWDKTNKQMVAEQARLAELNTLLKDTNIALYGNMEDMNLTQLTIKAEYEFQNMFKEFEQGVIEDSLEWFNSAISAWEEGDNSAIRDIVMEVYGDTKYLKDVNLNELRNEYVNYYWESGQHNETLMLEYEQAFKYICEDIEPYFKEAANYQETENGYTFEMTPELAEYAIQYAQAKEYQENVNGKWHTGGATAVGAAIGTVFGPLGTVIGAGAGAVSGAIFGFIFSMVISKTGEEIAIREDEWDDIAIALLAKGLTDETFAIEYNREAGDVVDITEKE